MAEGVQSGGAGRRRRLEAALQHDGREHRIGALHAGDAAAGDEVVAVQRPAARAQLCAKARPVAVQVLHAAGAAERQHGLGRAGGGDAGQQLLRLLEEQPRRQLAGEAGEVDGDAGKVDAAQATQLGRDLRHSLRQHALTAVAQVDGEQDLDGRPGRVRADRAGRGHVAQQHAVGHLRHSLELVGLRRADERERRQRVCGEAHERGQAGVGEAGGAGLEHRPPDARLAVDRLGDADQRDAVADKARGQLPRVVGDGAERHAQPGIPGHRHGLKLTS